MCLSEVESLRKAISFLKEGDMRLVKGFGFLVSLLVVILFAQNAGAVPVGEKLLQESDSTIFNTRFGSAVVDYEVYEYTTGDYAGESLYTYRIFNDFASTIKFNFFSVGILDGAGVKDPGFDSRVEAVDPDVWNISGSPVQSVDALFLDTIENGKSSALLWFISEYSSTSCPCTLFGTSSGNPVFARADLATPVPEPATIALLGIGGLIALIRKGRSA